MDPSQHTRDQGTIKTMGFYRWTQESYNAPVGQQIYGDSFWNIRSVIHIDYLQIGKTITGQ